MRKAKKALIVVRLLVDHYIISFLSEKRIFLTKMIIFPSSEKHEALVPVI